MIIFNKTFIKQILFFILLTIGLSLSTKSWAQAPPTITSFSPSSGVVGSSVTITGTGFNIVPGDNVVFFGGVKAVVTSATSTELRITIPTSNSRGRFQLVNVSNNLSCFSANYFSIRNQVSSVFTSMLAAATVNTAMTGNLNISKEQNFSISDFDGDSNLEITSSIGSSLYILTNNTPAISPVRSIITLDAGVQSSTNTLVGDFNNDGKLDLMTCRGGGNSGGWVFQNNSNPSISFSPKVVLPPASSWAFTAYDSEIGDLNKDGKIDIIGAYWLSGISSFVINRSVGTNYSAISEGDGQATYSDMGYVNLAPGATIPLGNTVSKIETGDFNNDGYEDYAVSGSFGFFVVLNTTNTVGPTRINLSPSSNFGFNASFISSGDFDSDGDIDLIAGDIGGDVRILTNNGSGSFTIQTTSIPSRGFSLADFDGDGNDDLIVYSSALSNYVFYKNISSGSIVFDTSQPVTIVQGSAVSGHFKILDFNGNGQFEIISANSANYGIYSIAPPMPTLNVVSALNAFSKCAGFASAPQTFTISGSNLTANIAIAALNGYEYSLNNSTYATTLSVVPTSGTVATTTVHVRLTAASTGTPAGNISMTSTGASTQTIAVSGTVNANPVISGVANLLVGNTITLTATTTASSVTPWVSSNTAVATVSNSGVVTAIGAGSFTITFTNSAGCTATTAAIISSPAPAIVNTSSFTSFSKCAGFASAPQTFTISGSNLTANIAIAALNGYEYSLNNSTYATTLSVVPTSGTVATTTVHVRLTAASTGTPAGNISMTSTGASTQTIAVSGTVNANPVISGVANLLVGNTITLTATTTASSVTPWVSSNTAVATVSNSGVVTAIGAGSFTITFTNSAGCTATTAAIISSPAPAIVNTSSFTSFSKCAGFASAPQTFTISGSNLTANIAIAALNGYEYSLNNSTYATTLSVAPTSGTVATTTIHVRLTEASTGTPAGNISMTSTGAITQTIAVTGTVIASPTITFNATPNVTNLVTTFAIPFTAVANTPTLYSVSAGTSNALANFIPIVDAVFSGNSGNLNVTIPAGATSGTYNFNVTVKRTTGCVSIVYQTTLTIVNTVLPVSFISFEAKLNNTGSVDLTWLTASESNNSHFIVSKSTDGVSFAQVAKISGSGNSNQQNRYQTADRNPASGNNYYQLVQFDTDGKATILATKVVNVALKNSNEVSVYPNPAQEAVNIKFGAGVYNIAKLIDLKGRVLASKAIDAKQAVTSFNIGNLPAGNYFIVLEGKTGSVSKSVIKN